LQKPSSSFDAVVVGGGVIGLAVGWRAAQRGLRVAVLDRAEPGHGTSWVAAGMLAPVAEARLVEQPLLELGLAAAQGYPQFVEELRAASDSDPGYLPCGTLFVARDRDEAESLERELELRQGLGLAVERLRPSDARRLEPGLAPTMRLALEVPGDHAIDPRKLTAALAQAFRRAGGELCAGVEVAALEVSPSGRVEGARLTGGELIDAEQVVVATGAWTEQLGGVPDDARVRVHPVKGQILRLHDPAGPGLLTRILRISGGYIVPRGDGRYVLGATTEERGLDTAVTAGATFELLRDAIELLPGTSELVIDELGAGVRPATADNAPAIGPGAIPGLHWAVGHYRNGILLCGITAELVVPGLLGEEPPELAWPFLPARFTDRAARSSAARSPARSGDLPDRSSHATVGV
jgi:glycine oxidase